MAIGAAVTKPSSRTSTSLVGLPEFVTSSRLCEELDIHPTTLWRWMRDGLGPKRLSIGHTVRFARDDVLSWIAERTRAGL